MIGVPGETKGEERPRAYVVKQPGATIDDEGVKKLVAEKLASYKRLTGGVRFVTEIPKSPNGKILKRILRDQVAAESKATGAKL